MSGVRSRNRRDRATADRSVFRSSGPDAARIRAAAQVTFGPADDSECETRGTRPDLSQVQHGRGRENRPVLRFDLLGRATR